MKILMVTTYLYRPDCPRMSRNRTGFGFMVNDIFDSVGKLEDVSVYTTSVYTEGCEEGVLPHKISDVIRSARGEDWARGFRYFTRFGNGLKDKARYLAYGLDRGYFEQLIRDLRPDLVHVHSIGYATWGVIESCEKLGMPFLVTLHGLIGLDDSTKAPSWNREMERVFLIDSVKRNTPVSVISTGMKRRIERRYIGGSAPNITVIPNGVAIERQQGGGITARNLRAEFGLSSQCRICLVIGNICERKNQIQIVEAMEQLQEDVLSKAAVFFCGNDTTNGSLQREIFRRDLGCHAFYLGYVSREALASLYNQADLNIVASRDEGFGLSIVEAFTHGIPTVTFGDLDAVADLYDSDCMVLARERSAKGMASAIEEALSRDWDEESIRNHAQLFSLETMARKYDKLYKRCIR